MKVALEKGYKIKVSKVGKDQKFTLCLNSSS
jgi:hypothetical protein